MAHQFTQGNHLQLGPVLCHVHRQLSETYKRPSTTETLKTIKQKPDESLWDNVKHICNARNTIPNIQDIEIIKILCDGVIDIKNVEEIAMKKLKTMVDLLAIAD
jgi:hypothetical protein